MDGFRILEPRHGLMYEDKDETFPTNLYCFKDQRELWFYNCDQERPVHERSTYFIYVHKGTAHLFIENDLGSYDLTVLREGQYASINRNGYIQGELGIAIERKKYYGLPMTGGPIESKGRLNYIDGCTDTLLIPPVIKGDACLNALFFPPGINQTSHTHPSVRLGIITKGSGHCQTPIIVDQFGNACDCFNLVEGMIWIIEKEFPHKFITGSQEDPNGMVVIAYHPESDFGCEHEKHPMINRTMVDGISASQLPDIQTKE